MSISIGHRAIFTAFGHRNSTTVRAHAPSSPAASPVGEAAAMFEAVVPSETGELTCSPWEGLYLEQAQPYAANGNDAGSGQQLESFLTSLMYGE